MPPADRPETQQGAPLPPADLIELLESNGYSQAADAIRAGGDPVRATAYVLAHPPQYDDVEGRNVLRYVERLHRG